MKKIFLALTAATALFGSDISGDYLMTGKEKNGVKTDNFMRVNYEKGGKVLMGEVALGMWKYDEKKKQIFVTSPFNPNVPEVYQVIKHDDKTLVLEFNGEKEYYIKLDPKKIAKENPLAPVIGAWKAIINKNVSIVFTATLPESFICIIDDKIDGSKAKTRGQWLYDPALMRLTVSGLHNPLAGESQIRVIDEATVEIDHDGMKIIAIKVQQ